jgi:hypothetical protein
LLAGLLTLVHAPVAVRADATDDSWAKYYAEKREEEWKKRVYGDGHDSVWDHLSDAPSVPLVPMTHYAALAYSPSTGKYGWAQGYAATGVAKQAAVDACKAPDARPVIWGPDGRYYALAAGKDGSAGATGVTAAKAKADALELCLEHTTDCKLVFCFFAND